MNVINADNRVVFTFTRELELADGDHVPGDSLSLRGTIENPLMPGRYSVDCWVRREGEGGDMAVQGLRLIEFVVFGAGTGGMVSVDADVVYA